MSQPEKATDLLKTIKDRANSIHGLESSKRKPADGARLNRTKGLYPSVIRKRLTDTRGGV